MIWEKERIQEILDRTVREEEAAGVSVLVFHEGTELGYAESGMADKEAAEPIARNTIFRMYSMTKPIIGFAAMKLFEMGKLDPLDPVSKYLPEYEFLTVGENREPLQRKLYLHHLLSMTSGITYGGTGSATEIRTQKLLDGIEKSAGTPAAPDTREIARMLAEIPLAFQPGMHWQYGMSADVLGAVIEQAAGCSLRDFLKEELFDPLGMNDTDFYVPEEKQSRLAAVYATAAGKTVRYSENHLGIANRGRTLPNFLSGGAGLFSTIDDYGRFAKMLLNGGTSSGRRYLPERVLKFFTSGSQYPSVYREIVLKYEWMSGYNYGNLMRCCEEPDKAAMLSNRGEYGWDGWLGSVFINDPLTRTTLLLMMQQTDAGFNSCARRIKNLLWRE